MEIKELRHVLVMGYIDKGVCSIWRLENGFLSIIQMYKTNNIDIDLLRKCLEALLIIIKNTKMVLNSIAFNGGFNLMLGLCEDIVLNSLEDDLGITCLGLTFCILTILYKKSKENDKKIIIITTTYMKKIVHQSKEVPVRDIREIICVLNFIWEHIVKSEESAKEFVQKDATYLMLDIIQKFPFVVQLVTLGVLVDLCEFGHCIPYLITWKGNGQRILQMLMQLFREENKRLNTRHGPLGEILDPRCPLAGKDQWFLTFCTCKPMMVGNSCISDLFLSCRPKIYALLQMLHMRHAENVQVANEHYKLYDQELEPVDQVTKLVAENFLALKLGEAWIELKEEFDRASISLTYIDYEVLSLLSQRAVKLAQHLQVVQNEIIQNANEKDIREEYKLYTHLEDGKLTEALETLSELKAIARTSEYMFRLSEKYKQNKQIDTAVKSLSAEAHRTYFSGIRVTPVFNEVVNLTSTATVSADDTDLIPVSPTESENHCNVDIPEDLLQSPSEITLSFQE